MIGHVDVETTPLIATLGYRLADAQNTSTEQEQRVKKG